MVIIIGTFLLIVVLSLLFYFSRFNDNKNSPIPYVTYENYPIVGHLFSFLRDRTKFLIECQQRYGQCFKIRLFTQGFTLVLSPPDWAAIMRNQSFYFPGPDLGIKIFDMTSNYSSKY
jgi:hypothetical protein